MKKILFILLTFLAVSCSKQKLIDMNTDVKHATEVPGQTLFSNAEKNLSDEIASISRYDNNFKIWAQYVSETTYTIESNYNDLGNSTPIWDAYYTGVLENLKRADSLIGMEKPIGAADIATQKNQRTIIDIVAVYTWDQMEIMWGNIPYTQALNINNILPAYDDALTIHKDLISRITADIAALDPSNASFGSADLIYGGDVSMWKEFANGLLVKMAIQIADVSSESALVKTVIADAEPGTFASPAGNAVFNYLGGTPNTNPLYVWLTLSGRLDYVVSNTIVDQMNTLHDPRLPFYFDQNLGANTYLGGIYGALNNFGNFTHIATTISKNPQFGNPLMTYSEIQFYLAEAAARGIITDAAATHYNNAITASMEYWGCTTDEAATYLAQPAVAYDQATWKDKIGTQAWISFYFRGCLGWTEWRRLGFPAMNMPPTPFQGGFPYRITYPIGEQTVNGANYTKAASAIGGDKQTTKLYWDIH